MKLITKFELTAKSDKELDALYRNVFNELARSNPDSHERRNALASLENIRNELASRAPCP